MTLQNIKIKYPKSIKKKIFPIFMPFFACKKRCIYCSQSLQSGQELTNYKQILQTSYMDLEKRTSPLELAFYGGTFTALPETIQLEFLKLAQYFRAKGIVTKVRCSTRPDCINASNLDFLLKNGLDLIELGIQSFNSSALKTSQRPYDKEIALHACQLIQDYNFELGLQLLPAMPGVSSEIFLEDVNLALSLKPNCLRYYPCLVVQDTQLAEMYKNNEYEAWTIEQTVKTLGQALSFAWEADIPVIRLSLAPQAGFEEAILAGPRHNALGSMIQAEALQVTIQTIILKQLKNIKPTEKIEIELPKSFQGFYAGHKNELAAKWQNFKITWY